MSELGRIGFVATRLAGTDGVSLETEKWSRILTDLGYACFRFAGAFDPPSERSVTVPEAHFLHPEILALNQALLGQERRSQEVSGRVETLKNHLKTELRSYLSQFGLDLLIVENALSLPLNIPLGLALTELIAETGIPTIAHHHDFAWERARFGLHAAGDYLRTAFPPTLPSIHHVVINSFAARRLAYRTGAGAVLIPNVMDFDAPPPPPDGYADGFRADFGLGPEDILLLQPSRVIPRKRIELAVELARRLDRDRCVLLISHAAGDEGSGYELHLQDYARLMDVRAVFGSEWIGHERDRTPDGRRIYGLGDAYHQAALVTYPSVIEGFGNAFLETLYYRRPIVISSYEIFRTDIQPKGFRVIAFDNFISDETVDHARRVLEDRALVEEMVEHNYGLGRRFYSFRVLEHHLAALMARCLGT